MNWQKWARFVVATVGVACTVMVLIGFRQGVPILGGRVATSDPKAVVESSRGIHTRVSKSHEDVDIAYGHLTSYADGSSKFDDVVVTTTRANGRKFTISAKAANVGKSESQYTLEGNVRIDVSDGMTVHTEHATYAEDTGLLRAPGPVDIARGRMTGSSVGMIYDKSNELLTLIDSVQLHVAANEKGAGAMEMAAPMAAFNRVDKTVHFEKGLKSSRGAQAIEADTAIAHLTDDEDHLQAIDLHGNAKIRGAQSGAGGLQALTGHDVSLKYGADGESIQHAIVLGDALIQLAGEQGHAGRQIGANLVEMAFAADGSTPTSLTANDGVQLTFPPEQGIPARTINAQHLDGRGDDQHGLTSARFDGNVAFHEQGGDVDRRAKSQALEVSLGPGLSTIDEARFQRAVRFEDASMAATADTARYVLDKGTLELGSEGRTPPHAETAQISIDAPKLSITLDGPVLSAAGSVKSVLKRQTGDQGSNRTPTMLKKDQDVIVTAGALEYDGNKSTAAYTGDVRLTQGDTSIKALSIVIDDKTGDLTASGDETNPVVTVLVREEEVNGRKPERVTSNAKAKDLKYADEARRLTYTSNAHMVGPAGDMTADKIDLYLKTSGDEIDHVEAFTAITLREKSGRTTTGSHLTYTSADEQYVVLGTPVKVSEACGRVTQGEELRLSKADNRITVAGRETARTQSASPSASCP